MRIDGIGYRPIEDVALKPKPVQSQDNSTTAGAATRRGELDQTGGVLRYRAEQNYNPTPAPAEAAPPNSPEAQAQQAATQVEQEYLRCATDGSTGAERAARRLRELTANMSPEAAALTLQYAQPTLDRIAADLGAIAGQEDGSFGDNKPRFDNVVSDLAAATSKAAAAPNGSAVVQQVAQTLVKHINPNEIGRFDEAFGKPIANGAGGELTAAVIKELQATGRVDQADDILQNVEDGINALHDRASDLADKVQKYNEELSWLVQQWDPMMTDDQLAKAIQAYKDKNPEYTQALAEIDQIATASLRALDSFGNAEKFSGLGHADDVQGALESLFNDPKTKSLIAQSPGVTAEIERLMQKAENNPGEPNFFDNVSAIAGKIDDGKFLTETIFNKALDATIDRTFNAAKAKDFGAVDRYISRLEKYADKLGYKDPQLKNVLQQFGRIARADTQQEAETALRVLARKIDSLNGNNPEIFSDNGQTTDKFRRFGLALGAAGTAGSISQAIDDPSLQNISGALVDAAGLTADAAQTGLVKNILQNKAWYNALPLEAAGKAFGGLGLALDAIGMAQSIKEGDYVDAGLSAASAVGGAMMIFGGAAVTGVGAVIVGAALIGKFLWSDHQESVKYENDNARTFLEGAGINPELANQLINNDNDGRSAAPVFTALAEKLGVNPEEFFTYLSSLEPDKAKALIEKAHGVDPNDEGVYPDEKPQPGYGGRGGYYQDPNPNDLTDLAEWMRTNGYADAPGL